MAFECRKASVRTSAAQWSADILVAAGKDLLPCSVSVLPTGATLVVPSGDAGERLLEDVRSALGFSASEPQVVKGGSCGGEEEEAEFAFTGAMLSVAWEFPREARGEFIARLRSLFGPCEGPAS